MKLRDFGMLTDENVDPDVVADLRSRGFDVWDVCENGWQGRSDIELLRHAVAGQRVIVTHDSDFGTLAMLGGEPVIGILYLRPGHVDAQFTIETINTVLQSDPDIAPPFVLVARRSGVTVSMRVRQIVP